MSTVWSGYTHRNTGSVVQVHPIPVSNLTMTRSQY